LSALTRGKARREPNWTSEFPQLPKATLLIMVWGLLYKRLPAQSRSSF
jgi:hypothetical protein